MPIIKYPIKLHTMAFRLWRQNKHNCIFVSKEMKKLGHSVSNVTIARWAEQEDWEAKEAVTQNELQRIMHSSDDPLLRELVMDDLEFAKFLRMLNRVLTQLFKEKSRRQLLPRNLKEAIDIAKYIREQREILLGNAVKPSSIPATINFNDNRRLTLKNQLSALPPEQREFVFKQARGVLDQESPQLEDVRRGLLKSESDAS